ncbi:MAG: efflux RND transporter periplasmic adaptor subunit [Desulfitobacteriaceae bacterium]
MNKKLKYTGFSLILLVLVGFLGYRIQNVLGKQRNLAQSIPIQTVRVQDVGKVKKENFLELYGNIDAINKVSVSSKVAGRVSRVVVDNGQAVGAGETLLSLEDQDYRTLFTTSQDTWQKAKLRLSDVQADYDRYQKLLAAGAVAQRDVDKSKLAVEAAQADLDSAQAGLDNAQQTLSNTTVTAPFAGVVAYRSVSAGQMVSPGIPLLTLVDISSVYALVNVKQEDLAQVRVGMSAQVILTGDALHPLTGIVSLISPVANPAARVFEARIKIDNKDGVLKPGMFVKTRITTGNPVEVLAVPQYALSGKENAYFVYVAEGNQARQRTVTIGATLGEMIEIQSGLKPGDKVIVTNVNKLKDEDQIAVAGQ